MTAERWWVRLAARWLARVGGVSEHIRLAMLGLTGISTGTLTLQQYGHGEYAWPFIGITAALTVVYTYLYTEGGVWNQVARDRADLSSNFIGPTMRMDDELTARGIVAAQRGKPLSENEREAVKQELDDAWGEYRDGIDVEGLDNA